MFAGYLSPTPTHARYADWHVGQQQSTPLLSVLSKLVNGPSGVVEGLPFYNSKPGVLGSSLFLLPLWCPVKGCAGDVAWLSSHLMSDPSQSSLHDDRAYAVLVAAGEKMLVGDGFGPEYSRLLRSRLVILEYFQPYSRVETMHLWYSLSLVLVLYWDAFHKLFSILKAFLDLLRRFLMSLPAPPSCLAVLSRKVNSSVVQRSAPFTLTGE